MINKTNWQLMKKYLEYRLNVEQISNSSLRREQTHMRYLLQWSQGILFSKSGDIRPTLPDYLRSFRLDGKSQRLSAVYIKKILSTARYFFTWLSDNETGYKHLKQSWIRTIKIKRLSDVPKNREIVTLEEVLLIASCPAHTIWERRTRASLVFLFLSAQRIGAFISMPIQAVDINNRVIYQYPSLGVRTKNNKYGITYLLDIPELLQVVKAWDDEVRQVLPQNGFWFAPLDYQTGKINPDTKNIGEHRATLASRDFKKWLQKNNLPYHSSHKFRHGHTHYGLLHSKNMADFKAVSLNLMHSTMQITDSTYSVLQTDEVKNRITTLSKGQVTNEKQELISLLENLLQKMKG